MTTFSATIGAQATVMVSPSDRVYANIDRLIQYGLVDKVIVSQQPYSRREIARIVKAAALTLERLEANQLAGGAIAQKAKDSKYRAAEDIVRALSADDADELRALSDSSH